MRILTITILGGLGLLSPRLNSADSKTGLVDWTPPATYNMGDAVVVPDMPGIKSVWLAGRPMTYLKSKKIWLGVAPFGTAGIVFHLGKRKITEKVVKVISPPIKLASDVRIPSATWKSLTDNEDKRAVDRTVIRKVLNDFKGKFATKCWKTPIRSRVTSPFGSPRRLPDGHAYHHLGEDRRAAVGTPVKAIGDGRVAFAGEMVHPGLNVVIAHGEGWFSRYLHFSKLKTSRNARVKTGQVIGLSGASGRVEAPHLHWEILWRGIPANPARFLPEWGRLCDQG